MKPGSPIVLVAGLQPLNMVGRLARALPALFANLWWTCLCLGVVAAALGFLSGTVLSSLHDDYWLPVLFRVLLSLPGRWLVTVLLMVLLVWRADVPSNRGALVAFAAGGWLGVLVFYDVWYYYPFLVAVWAAFLTWRVGWILWSYPGGGFAMAGLTGLVLAGAAFSTDVPLWDNRFTLGRAGAGNFLATAALLLVAVLAVGLAFALALRGGISPRPSRPPLKDLIEREPRMSSYLDAVLAVTGNRMRIARSGRLRFAPAAGKLPKLRGDGGVFGEARTPWARHLQWNLALAAIKIPGVSLVLRSLRTPFTRPGLRSVALTRLLYEGVSREHARWSVGRDETAALNFARGLALREALIEVSLHFGREVPAPDLAAEAVRLGEFIKAPNRGSAPETPADPVWARAAVEYEDLWFQNCERLFLTRGERFTLPLFRPEEIADANAIRAALKTTTADTAWVADRLKLSPLHRQLDLTPADPDSDPEKPQLVAALNHLIETAQPVKEKATVAGSLMDRRTPRTVATPTNRRAGMLRLREELARAFDPALAPATDWVDFRQLSRTWLICRLASGGSVTLHRAAANLALAVFALEVDAPNLVAQAAELLGRSYLDLHGSTARPPCRLAVTPPDRADAARCALLCALWQAHLGHWMHAGGPLTLGLIDFKDAHVPETVLRGSAHLHAAIFERRLSTSGPSETVGAERALEDILRQFEALDACPKPAGLLFGGRVPGHVLARSFASRIHGRAQ